MNQLTGGNARIALIGLLGGALVFGVWGFPMIWYKKPSDELVWLSIVDNPVGWKVEVLEVDDSAERILAADELVYSRLTIENNDNRSVKVFTAKRFDENPNEIGLFVHTPDRCWTEAGWVIKNLDKEASEINVHGLNLLTEKRLFRHGNRDELVFFFGLVGGKSLPYRLDHNLSVGRRYRPDENTRRSGAFMRASDTLLWHRVWQSFASRERLFGPKQFVRLSTEVKNSLEESDALLRRALVECLTIER